MSTVAEKSRVKHLQAAADCAARAGSSPAPSVVQRYFRHVATEDLLPRDPADLYGAVVSHVELGHNRPVGTAAVSVFNPTVEAEGWRSEHTVVQIVTDDMPFLVDSVNAAVAASGRAEHLLVHPVLIARRTVTGQLVDLPDSDEADAKDHELVVESWIYLEVDRIGTAAEREALANQLAKVLEDVRSAVEDWPKMRARALEAAEAMRRTPPVGIPAREASATADFLEWMADNHFTFLGHREYVLVTKDGAVALQPVQGTGLGLLRYDQPESEAFSRMTAQAQNKAREKTLLILTKANSKATVHRPVYLDYVGVKTFDETGEVTGEHRFLGLYALSAFNASVLGIPIIGDRVREVLERAGFHPDSHSGKDVLQVMEHYPREELFQTSVDQLQDVATSVIHLQERRKTKLFLRQDDYGRFMSCLVYIPRDRYNTTVRLRIEKILREAFHGVSVEDTTRVSDSALARLHYVIRVASGEGVPEVDAAALEQEIVDATRTWDEDFAEAVRVAHGEEVGAKLLSRYGRAFPEAYKEDFAPRVAVADLKTIDALGDQESSFNLYQEPGAPGEQRRFKLYRREELSLTRVLPIFTHLGVEVVDERPYEVEAADGSRIQVYDFGLRASTAAAWGVTWQRDEIRARFQDAVAAVWDGRVESDGFNALVLGAGLTWRQVVILRAVAKYLRQTGSTFSQEYVESALMAQTEIARKLVDLFTVRLDPDLFDGVAGDGSEGAVGRAAAEAEIVAAIQAALDDVTSLDHDRIVRALLGVIQAALRTNFFQTDAQGAPKAALSIKLDPSRIPDLPAPRPMFEIWVYSPQVEGVHLRFGKVARGGLRWSDRREDFRTEILGLVKAQMVKNAVIVPTGSKGGFFPKALPDPAVDRDAWLAEGVASYRVFISGLLDLTDNRVSGQIVPPARVVRHDEDDPYLVVAADKGTATFSDYANAKSQEYGFWLDDAFASGGSAGYDHKTMGITARGAWESVKRHFREMGIDTQSEDFTVVGVGDMSGDVFGNGMLLSEHIRLIAAFDHRHVFVDPDPDPAASFAERRRLFDLPRSSWGDYTKELISAGGGVFPRSAKSVDITAAMAAALGIDPAVTKMTPTELIHAILLAPADLLWNGGIGTYVKASTETHSDIGDRANDAIRVNGNELRVKVVGEGGNLGCSQHGRIEAALGGVRINTDALDNSAGVDTSDHEVNIKILLSEMVRSGDMTLKQRNAVLVSMTDEVAHQVLRDNYEQNVLIGNARAQQFEMVAVHARLLRYLEEHVDLDRALEALPTPSDLAKRHAAGRGLTSPEFAVLIAYSKLSLKADLLASGLPDDPWFQRTVVDYFPAQIRDRYAGDVANHPLRREIITNAVANSMVNRGGITYAFRAGEETGARVDQIARAFVVSREVFDLAGYVKAVEALDNVVSTEVQTQLYLEFRRLMDRAARWFLTARPAQLDVAAEVERFAAPVAELAPQLHTILQGTERARLEARAAQLRSVGVPKELALRHASLLDQFSLLDIVELSLETGTPPVEVAQVYFHTSEQFGIDEMLTRVSALPREDRWDSLARGAMRDDLYAVLEALAQSVLEASKPGTKAAARYAAWATANEDSVGRAQVALGAVRALDAPGIAPLSVALRTLRGVVRGGAANG
jgi:glutamate dehydrogenase